MKRFLLDDDGTNFLNNLTDDIAGDVEQNVRECSPAVTTVLVCSQAGFCFYPTAHGTPCDQRLPVLDAAHQRGQDPLGMWLQAHKAQGREVFITCRMNDVHNPTESWNTPLIRRDDPNCIVGVDEVQQGKPSWMSYCMDYTHQKVREHMLALIREQIERYGNVIDGFQLDWLRFPRHLSGSPAQVWEKREIITEFTAEVRRMLDQTGRDILLSARVPTSLAGCQAVGLDVQSWTKQKLINMLVICPFLTTDWQLPVNEFRLHIEDDTFPIYSGFDLGYGPQVHYPESMRGICTSLYEDKPDGLYLFNFPCWIERLAARPYHWLTGLDDPSTAAIKPLVLSVNHQRSRQHCDLPALIPVTIAAGASFTLPVRVPAAALPSWRALVHVETTGGDIHLQLGSNGKVHTPREGDAGNACRSEVFIEFVNHYRPQSLRGVPENCRQFEINTLKLMPGINDMVFINPGSSPVQLQRFNLNLW